MASRLIECVVCNWKSVFFFQLNGKADLRLEANYFNEELSEWEPLIEKLETRDGFRPWELSVGVSIEYVCFGGMRYGGLG